MSSGEPARAGGRIATTTLSRSYAVPFADVWDLVLATVGGLGGWRVMTHDSREGTMRIMSLSPVRHRPMEAGIRLWLDEMGQTRLEIRFNEPRHILLPPVARQRGERFLRRVDRALAKRGTR